MKRMKNLSKYLVPVAAVFLFSWAWKNSGWSGVMLVISGIVMWLLLHFTNLMVVLRRAKRNPIGYVGSAVMINAQLQENMTLLRVIGMTRSLGEQESPKDAQPEVFVWHDNSDNRVRAVFMNGKLKSWEFTRPELVLPDR